MTVPATFNFSADVVDHWAADPTRPALIWENAQGEERQFSYAEIAERVARFGNLLRDLGIAQGDRVIVMLPRIPEWQIAMVACTRIGAIPIPCITMLTADDLSYRVRHSGAVGVVAPGSEVGKFETCTSLRVRVAVEGNASPVPGWVSFDESDQKSRVCEPATVAAEDAALLYYTSGSTGPPKGVIHSSRALWTWRRSAADWLGLEAGDLIWCTADTGWSKAGTSVLFGPWSRGSAVFFYDGPFEARKRLELLSRHRVTHFCAAATELRRLILEDVSGFDLGALRSTVSAGESVNPEIIERWRERMGTTVLDGYGQTETLMTVTNRPGMPVKAGSMGRALPGCEVAALTEEESVARRSASGELLLRLPNPQLMLGYWEDAERTAGCFVEIDGVRWFRTGDNVELDEDGYVFYAGRVDDIINSAGYRIGPQEVENALSRHAAVQECAVVGVPDAERGEIVKAWVVLNTGFEPTASLASELQMHTKSVTAPYKYPRRIEFTGELPKTVTGKIQRNLLRARG